MKSSPICALIAPIGLILSLNGFGQQATNQTVGIKTNFAAEAQLSNKEVSQILLLAKACGIKEPGEVETFHYLPTMRRGIRVNSVERVGGRDTFFETLEIEKEGWRSNYVAGKDVKRVGEFTAKPKGVYTTRLRSYEFRKKPVKVVIAKAINVEIADKAIALIAESKVKFKSDWERKEFERIENASPTRLNLSLFGNGFELQMDEPHGGMHDVIFVFQNGEVVIASVAAIVI